LLAAGIVSKSRKETIMLWRQGDILIADIPAIPEDAERLQSSVLVTGEVTGHAHRVESLETVEVWEDYREKYLKVLDTTRILHEEHLPITLPPGIYRVWRQREYTPRGIPRAIAD
jgi:hypothetical protein